MVTWQIVAWSMQSFNLKPPRLVRLVYRMVIFMCRSGCLADEPSRLAVFSVIFDATEADNSRSVLGVDVPLGDEFIVAFSAAKTIASTGLPVSLARHRFGVCCEEEARDA